MAEKVSEIPDETEALVELQRYYLKARVHTSIGYTLSPLSPPA